MKCCVAIFRAGAGAALGSGFKTLKKKELHVWLLAALTVNVCVCVLSMCHFGVISVRACVCVRAHLSERERASVAYH